MVFDFVKFDPKGSAPMFTCRIDVPMLLIVAVVMLFRLT
jgi:hypothetical protein